MDPPHDDKRKYLDRQHQPRAQGLGQHGEGAAEEADLYHRSCYHAVGQDGQEDGALLGVLVGRDRAFAGAVNFAERR